MLLIRLPQPLVLEIARFRGQGLEPGYYAYCGSARGPGGLAARIGRHLRCGKRRRWHIDRLTAAARIEAVAVDVGGHECALAGALLAAGGRVPLPGFGSSDCRHCPSHLVAVADASAVAGLCR